MTCPIADRHARQYRHVGPEPHAPADHDARRVHVSSPARRHVVVQRRDDGVVADEGSIADVDAALVLEPAAAVDEHILTETDVLAEVSAERREESEGIGDLVPGQLTHQGPHLSGGVVAPVELGGDAQRLLTRGVHGRVVRRTSGDRLPGIQCRQKVLESLNFSHLPTIARP